MIAAARALIRIAALVLAGVATAGEMSPPLTIEAARVLVAATGVNPGKIFPVGQDRYIIDAVEISGGGRDFRVRFVIRPLERRAP